MFNSRILKNTLGSVKGFSLIELMISIGATAAVMLVLIQVAQDLFQDIQRNHIMSTRDQVVALIRQNAGDPRILSSSLTQVENVQFKNCVCGGGAACSSAISAPVTLYETNKATPVIMYFDEGGFPCDKTARNCVIEVKTQFIAQCMPIIPSSDPLPPASCTTPAEFIAVIFTVQQNSQISSQGNLIRPVSGAVYTQVKNFADVGSGACP